MKKEIEKQEKQELAKEKRAMIDRIIEHILNAIEDGAIKVPSVFYNYKNALSMAKLALLGVKTKHKAPVLNDYNKSDEAKSGTPGVWSHTSFRPDKSDVHPQPELIQMLKIIQTL